MVAEDGLSQAAFEEELVGRGFEPTDRTSNTGRYWRRRGSNVHLLVPYPERGRYPGWVVLDIRRQIIHLARWLRPRPL